MSEPLEERIRDVWADAATLAPLLRARDEGAWCTFVAGTAPTFRRYVAALTGYFGDVADDVVQETYVRVLLKIDTLKSPEGLRAWAFRILHNCAIDVFRRQGLVVPSLLDEDIVSAGAEPGERYAAVEVLARLPLALRATVLLVDGYGFPYADTARILGIDPGTVGSRLNTARRMLRRLEVTR